MLLNVVLLSKQSSKQKSNLKARLPAKAAHVVNQELWQDSTAISYQLSAISYQLSAISYQLSAISYQLSAISYQLSAISCQTLEHRQLAASKQRCTTSGQRYAACTTYCSPVHNLAKRCPLTADCISPLLSVCLSEVGCWHQLLLLVNKNI